jgi:hypothetical protein
MCTICGVTVTALAVHMNAVHTGGGSVILAAFILKYLKVPKCKIFQSLGFS